MNYCPRGNGCIGKTRKRLTEARTGFFRLILNRQKKNDKRFCNKGINSVQM